MAGWSLDAPSAREFPGLEAFLAEHGAPLRRFERHGGFFAARRTRRDRFHPFARHTGADRASRPLALTGLAALRLVFEVLVGEELLFTRRPDELRRAIHAPEDPVLELHRSLPRGVGHSDSRRSFLRLRLRASACLALRLSPGFK